MQDHNEDINIEEFTQAHSTQKPSTSRMTIGEISYKEAVINTSKQPTNTTLSQLTTQSMQSINEKMDAQQHEHGKQNDDINEKIKMFKQKLSDIQNNTIDSLLKKMEEKTQFVTNETFNLKFKSLETTLADNMSYMQKMQESIVKMAQSISQIGGNMQNKTKVGNNTNDHPIFKSPTHKKE